MQLNLPISIEQECSQFIQQYTPVYQLLTYGDAFRKVKIRVKKNHQYEVERTIDDAFSDVHQNVRLRSTIASLEKYKNVPNDMVQYNVFPVNSYKILYNPAGCKYHDMVESLSGIDHILHNNSEIFKLSLINGTVLEAADSKSDIIIYGIKYYYAIETKIFEAMNPHLQN